MPVQATSFDIKVNDCVNGYMSVIRDHFHYHPDNALTWIDGDLAARWASGLNKRSYDIIRSNDRNNAITGIAPVSYTHLTLPTKA